jgi:hypothetical protein
VSEVVGKNVKLNLVGTSEIAQICPCRALDRSPFLDETYDWHSELLLKNPSGGSHSKPLSLPKVIASSQAPQALKPPSPQALSY